MCGKTPHRAIPLIVSTTEGFEYLTEYMSDQQLEERTTPVRVLSLLSLLISFALLILSRYVADAAGVGLVLVCASMFYLATGAAVISFSTWTDSERKLLILCFITAYLLRFTASIFLIPDELYYLMKIDGRYYVEIASRISAAWHTFSSPYPIIHDLGAQAARGSTHWAIFAYVAAHLKFIDDPLILCTTNSFLSAICIFHSYRIIRTLFSDFVSERIAIAAMFSYALFPLSIFWTANGHFKEPITLYLTTLFLDYLIVFLKGKKLVASLIVMLSAILLLSVLRMYLAPLMILTALLAFAFFPEKPPAVKYAGAALILITVVFFQSFLTSLSSIHGLSTFTGYVQTFLRGQLFSTIVDTRERFATDGPLTAVGQTTFSSLPQFIAALPIGIFRVFTSPIRWFIYTSEGNGFSVFYNRLLIAGTAVWYMMLPFSVFGFVRLAKKSFRRLSPILFFIILTSIMYVAIFYGASERRNIIFYPFLCLFFAVGISDMKRNILPALAVFILLFAGVTATELTLPSTILLLAAPGLAVVYSCVKIDRLLQNRIDSHKNG